LRRARYYHPQLRRFLNQDTVLGSIGTPASLNRFAYANGNPISAIDPFGTMAQDVAPNNPSSGDKLTQWGTGFGAGGAAAGLVENVQNGLMGFWVGKNWNILSTSFGGNGATGGRLIFAGRMASYAKTGGNILGGLGVGVSALQGYDAFQKNDANGMVQAGADTAVGIAGFFGPVGWAGSTGYFAGQQLDRVFGITDAVANVVTASPPPTNSEFLGVGQDSF
jgi:hypothetical protein